MKPTETIVDRVETPGLTIDTDEAWRKISERQFAGDPGRAGFELVQNALDAYLPDTPLSERMIEIATGTRFLRVTDYGEEGMPLERLRLLLTLGGSDKAGTGKLGKFGIGFSSIFNRALATRSVSVRTHCEGHNVELLFVVPVPGRKPVITARRIPGALVRRTVFEVEFGVADLPDRCLRHIIPRLAYLPAPCLVNGERIRTVWEEARRKRLPTFADGACSGFVQPGAFDNQVDVLCKHERIIDMQLVDLIRYNWDRSWDLRTYARQQCPFVRAGATVNADNLSVTISRDSFYLDSAWEHMVATLARAFAAHLERVLRKELKPDLVLANQYVFRERLHAFLESGAPADEPSADPDPFRPLIRRLATAPIHRINGSCDPLSLHDLWLRRTPGTPVFYSPHGRNLRWLGGSFRHDYIVLPAPCRAGGGAPDFHEELFGTVFGDAVNLDTVPDDPGTIADLVSRGIVDRTALTPNYRIIGTRALTAPEARLATEIEAVVNRDEIRRVIAANLHIRFNRIHAVFFETDEERREARVATGLFDAVTGAPVSDPEAESSGERVEPEGAAPDASDPADILLGLQREHPFIRHLLDAGDPHRAYYAIEYLAGQLCLCQKRLAPEGRFYHWTKERLAADLRHAAMESLLAPPLEVAA